MIKIENLNNSANLTYFKKYLNLNYDFKNFIIGVDSICLEFKNEPSDTEKTIILSYYNNIVESDWIEFYKTQKFEEINNKTQELIELGYIYNGLTFSLSDHAQTNILALYSTKDDGILTYPILWNTIDDLNTFEILDRETISNIYYTALATKKAHLDSGTALKSLIRTSNTIQSINLIIDNR